MHLFARLLDFGEAINEAIGRLAAWLLPLVVALVFAVVVLRYGFGWGRVWMQESYLWLHAAAFLLGAPWALSRNAHVRIDVFYARLGSRARALINLIGSLLLLLPFTVVILIMSWPYVGQSWALRESSREAGGLPGLYLLKSLIIVFAATLLLQGVVLAGRSLLVLTGIAARRSPPGSKAVGADLGQDGLS